MVQAPQSQVEIRLWDLVELQRSQKNLPIKQLALIVGIGAAREKEPQQLFFYAFRQQDYRLYAGDPLPEYEICVCLKEELAWELVQPAPCQPGQPLNLGGEEKPIAAIDWRTGKVQVEGSSEWLQITQPDKKTVKIPLEPEWIQGELFNFSGTTCPKRELL